MVGTISWLSSIMVGGLAIVSFSLSFEALRDLAVREHVVPEKLGYLFPFMVDGAIVVFSLCALRASLRKESATMMRMLVVFATTGSVLFNMMHVGDSWLARCLAATPPVLLFLSFESLMHSIQKEMERGIKVARKEADKPLSKEARLAEVKRLLAEGLSASEIVERLPSVSLRTIQRDIGVIEKNTR